MRGGPLALFLIGTALVVGVVLLRAWPMINVVETGRTPEYPDILPRQYQAEADRVFEAVLHVVHQLPRWTVVDSWARDGVVRAEVRSRVFRFVDDVEIRVNDDTRRCVVHVRSASRIGRGDFGQNARTIRGFFQALDREMGRQPIHP